MNTLDELTKAGVNVYIQNLPLCTLNEDGQPNPIAKMITAVLSSFAEIERDNIKYRLNSGRELAKAKGVKRISVSVLKFRLVVAVQYRFFHIVAYR